MALPQLVTKTYSRRRSRQADVSHAERTFDEVFHGAARPPARTAATAEKWGSASFKRISNTTRTSPKRRLSPTSSGDDPFSFDSDDDNVAKKSRKENVMQKTSATKQTGDDAEYRSVGEKSRGKTMNLKEKSFADGVMDEQQPTSRHDESRAKQYIDKMTRCRTTVKAKLKESDDCTDSERNGLSAAHCVATTRMSGKGDSLAMNARKCWSNGLDSDTKTCYHTGGRNTRSSDTLSPCKTTQQLQVFVDNFSQLISSRRSPAGAGKHAQSSTGDNTHDNSCKSSSVAEHDSRVKKSKSSENCRNELGHSQFSTLRRAAHGSPQRVSSVTTQLQQNTNTAAAAAAAADDDDDDDDVVLLSPLVRQPVAVHSVGATHKANNTSKTSSRTSSSDTVNNRNSSCTKANSRISRDSMAVICSGGSGSNKNMSVVSKSGQLRSRMWRTGDECATDEPASTTAGATTTTTTATTTTTTTTARRLLTGSHKVVYLLHLCTFIRLVVHESGLGLKGLVLGLGSFMQVLLQVPSFCFTLYYVCKMHRACCVYERLQTTNRRMMVMVKLHVTRQCHIHNVVTAAH